MGSFPLHKGYLTKSPPENRITGRYKTWRKRWFVLHQNKNLEYYEERNGKFKKSINLNLCTCLDTNLSHKKFENIFSITIKGKHNGTKSIDRTYFLVADTSYEMAQWIENICKVCNFQITAAANGQVDAVKENQEANITSHLKDSCRLEYTEQLKSGNRDSGIHVAQNENNNNSNLVPISPPTCPPRPVKQANGGSVQDIVSCYDDVPPPVPANSQHSHYDFPSNPCQPDMSSLENGNLSQHRSSLECVQDYDVPPSHQQPVYNDVPAPVAANFQQSHYSSPSNTCPLDMSSSSEDGSLSQHRSSLEYESNYDVPPSYQQSSYDEVPPPISKYPNKQYDVPSSSNKQPSFFDSHQPTYDVPNSSHDNSSELSNELIQMDIYDHVPPQVPTQPLHYQSPNPVFSNYDTVPSHRERSSSNDSAGGTYDYVPPPVQASMPALYNDSAGGTYDYVPPPVQASMPSLYDYVPSREESVEHVDSSGGSYDMLAPPLPQKPKPSTGYVNLTYPVVDTSVYDKPLPIPPGIVHSERDSGTVADFFSDDVYDVPPSNQLHQGVRVPVVDRSSKPSLQTIDPPVINRLSKPEINEGRHYVNLPKSSTFRDIDRKAPHVKVKRSKSVISDKQADGYLFMENPKRTESSSRFSKKNISAEKYIEEDDAGIEYEYMDSSHARASETYENFNPQALTKIPKPETSDKKLKGHYQDIDIISNQREGPTIPKRKTNYTTIDLVKTKGFRETCTDVSKGK